MTSTLNHNHQDSGAHLFGSLRTVGRAWGVYGLNLFVAFDPQELYWFSPWPHYFQTPLCSYDYNPSDGSDQLCSNFARWTSLSSCKMRMPAHSSSWYDQHQRSAYPLWDHWDRWYHQLPSQNPHCNQLSCASGPEWSLLLVTSEKFWESMLCPDYVMM